MHAYPWQIDSVHLWWSFIAKIVIAVNYFHKKAPEASTGGVLLKKGVFKNFTKFSGKHLCQSLRPATLSKKRLRCFPASYAKFLKTPFFTESSGGCFWGSITDVRLVSKYASGTSDFGLKLLYKGLKRL